MSQDKYGLDTYVKNVIDAPDEQARLKARVEFLEQVVYILLTRQRNEAIHRRRQDNRYELDLADVQGNLRSVITYDQSH